MNDLRYRQIHLDFHTGPDIPGIGADFDPEAFAEAMEKARVDSVTLFAKCHHGHLYYETEHPAKHPHLTRDLLTEQIDALQRRNIRCPIYLSLMCDEYAANQHPEWIALSPDGTRVGLPPIHEGTGVFPTGWQILDMASPYLDYFCEQLEEVLKKYAPADGYFFDMCWDQVSVSNWAKTKMAGWGLNPDCAEDRSRYARRLVLEYMERISALVNRYQPGAPVWYNSRPISNLIEEKKFLKHVEIEALPTAQWGYLYFPLNVRLARPLGLPMLGMTGRFHKGWADFGGVRAPDSLLYDCVQALAHGAGCSVGDQLSPRGVLDAGAYDVIGQVYQYVEQCEPWCRDVTFPKEIAVLYLTQEKSPAARLAYDGVYRALTRFGYQYQFVAPEDDWEDYAVVIVPEPVAPCAALAARLEAYEAKGGKVLIEMPEGLEPSPFSATYLRFAEGERETLPQGDHVFYERGGRLVPQEGDEVVAEIVEPYFERDWRHFSSHFHTPPKLGASPYAAAVIRGNRALVALPAFRCVAEHAAPASRQLVRAVLRHLLPDPVLRVEQGPTFLEPVVNLGADQAVVHLLSFIPRRTTAGMETLEDKVTVCDVVLSLRTGQPVKSVTLQPQGKPVAFASCEGRTEIRIDRIDGHAMVVVES